MVRRDINEANVVRQGIASAALEDGASVGQVASIDADGELAFVDGGGGGGALPDPITTPVTIDVDGSTAFRVRDALGQDVYVTVDTVSGTIELSADPQGGKNVIGLSVTALTYKDENGAIMLDIEGGYASLGPGGEVAVTTGQIYLALPTSPGPSGSLWNDSNTVKVVP